MQSIDKDKLVESTPLNGQKKKKEIMDTYTTTNK